MRRAALLLILILTFFCGTFGRVSAQSRTPAPATSSRSAISSHMPKTAPTRILSEKLKQYAGWITQNDDFCGWLTIPGTVMDYPVVYGPDYVFYVENDFNKIPSVKGAVFTDYRNLPDDPGRNIILYAHHMKDGSMFGSLKKFNDLSFVRKHPVFTYDTLYGERRYQVFAVLIVPIDYRYTQISFDTPNEFTAFTDYMRSISLYTTDLDISGTDEIITLSTCWYDFTDARFIVQAVRLPDGVEGIPAVYEINRNRVKDW